MALKLLNLLYVFVKYQNFLYRTGIITGKDLMPFEIAHERLIFGLT